MNQKKQLKISLPIAFEYLVNILMTLVDTVAVSIIGTKELGKNDYKKIKLISGNSLILTIIVSIITILIVALIKPVFPVMFNVDAICNTYLIIRLMGFIL